MRVLLVILLLTVSAYSVPVEEFGDDVEYAEPEYLDELYAQGNYEEFSRLLGIEPSHLSIPKSRSETSDPTLNKELYHGDILLTPQQREEGRNAINFQKYPRSRWPGYVPYTIAANNFTASQRASILSYIDKWNSYFNECLSFTPRKTEPNYVYFFKGDGCYSYVGCIQKPQPISMGNGCMLVGIAIHEMMHCIGFDHEQNRPDRDTCIRMLWENIPSDWQSQYEKCSSSDYVTYTGYDYYSLMHYPTSAPVTRKPAFEVLKSNIDTSRIGQRNDCTELDKEKIRKLYGCKLNK